MPELMGMSGAVFLFAIYFLAYGCGGYVAARSGRFSGALQSVLMWLWALVAAASISAVAEVVGHQFNIFARLNVLPRLPLGEGSLTPATAITAVLVVILSLVGAIAGAVLGAEFQRRSARHGTQY